MKFHLSETRSHTLGRILDPASKHIKISDFDRLFGTYFPHHVVVSSTVVADYSVLIWLLDHFGANHQHICMNQDVSGVPEATTLDTSVSWAYSYGGLFGFVEQRNAVLFKLAWGGK